MWFLLLVWVDSNQYSATSVHATLEDCRAHYTSEADVCATVTLNVIELPSVPEVETSVLPEMGPRG